MSLLNEFKAFAVKGNVVDMAVGIIVGAAFGKIVSSFVGDVVMPPIGLLIGGVVVTESVFAIPGLGRMTVDAILRRDYPIIQGVILMFAFVYVLINLLVDLSYTLFDP
eukprot:gene13622-16655_t